MPRLASLSSIPVRPLPQEMPAPEADAAPRPLGPGAARPIVHAASVPVSSRDGLATPSGTAPRCADVLTQHNRNGRDGANTCARLTPATVSGPNFGKVFCRPVDGHLYAQPLVVHGLEMPGIGTRNVVFVATMHNTVYAFDAADPQAKEPYWRVNLGPHVPASDIYPHSSEIKDAIGILSTPVIDRTAGTLYAVAATREDGPNGERVYRHHLHALNLTTGEAKLPKRRIEATYPGGASDAKDGLLHLNHRQHMQRPSLLLDHGRIYIGFGSHRDDKPYHGWVVAYDAATLQPAGTWVATPNTQGAGVWQSGGGLTADAKGDLYVTTGNAFDIDARDTSERGESLVKLRPNGTALQMLDWFTPYNWKQIDDDDVDFGSTSAVLIPGTDLVVAGSKEGYVYVTRQGSLGHISEENSAIVQRLVATDGRLHSSPVFWRSDSGGTLYTWGQASTLKAFALDAAGERFVDEPAHASTITSSEFPSGGTVTVSANGTHDGIVWATLARVGSGNRRPGILRAFDATNVSRELWSSQDNPERDGYGHFSKFVSPTIGNDTVFVPTFSGELVAYGLLAPSQGAAVGCSVGPLSAAQPSYTTAPLLSLLTLATTLWLAVRH
jgi:hypothetical protein